MYKKQAVIFHLLGPKDLFEGDDEKISDLRQA